MSPKQDDLHSRDESAPSNSADEEMARDEAVAQQIEEIPADEGADVLENLPAAEAADVAEYLDPQTAGRILAEMDPQRAANVLDDMEAPEASMVVASMDPDDRVDVLEHLSDKSHAAIVKELGPEDRADVQLLEQYPPDTAGGIMTTDVTALDEEITVEQAVVEIRRFKEEFAQLYYIYVIDKRRHLVGVLATRDLLLSKPDRKLRQLMRTEVARVPTGMDQEFVARQMRRYKYLAMPVVDDYNRLVGMITVDDIVDVIHEEATEDVQKMFGAGPEESLSSPWIYSFRQRIGWLEVNLLMSFLAAWIISRFTGLIAALPMLAAYQMIVAGMASNACMQSLAVAIRGLAIGEGGRKTLFNVLRREAGVGVLTGLVVGLTAAIAVALGVFGNAQHHYSPWVLSAVVGGALLINHFMACTMGVVIPFVMRRLGLDPAQSATVWATMVTNCCAFFTTLELAHLSMRWLGH